VHVQLKDPRKFLKGTEVRHKLFRVDLKAAGINVDVLVTLKAESLFTDEDIDKALARIAEVVTNKILPATRTLVNQTIPGGVSSATHTVGLMMTITAKVTVTVAKDGLEGKLAELLRQEGMTDFDLSGV
jgi:hypothetical protein